MFIALVITCITQYAVDITHLVNFDVALVFIFYVTKRHDNTLPCFKLVGSYNRRDEDKLICFYQMKTAVFRAIKQNALSHLHAQSLRVGFWVCFKLLITVIGCTMVCNNMFPSNIFGKAQTTLYYSRHCIVDCMRMTYHCCYTVPPSGPMSS